MVQNFAFVLSGKTELNVFIAPPHNSCITAGALSGGGGGSLEIDWMGIGDPDYLKLRGFYSASEV
jgi:hypothetical protein